GKRASDFYVVLGLVPRICNGCRLSVEVGLLLHWSGSNYIAGNRSSGQARGSRQCISKPCESSTADKIAFRQETTFSGTGPHLLSRFWLGMSEKASRTRLPSEGMSTKSEYQPESPISCCRRTARPRPGRSVASTKTTDSVSVTDGAWTAARKS